jgi:hypothetical protein
LEAFGSLLAELDQLFMSKSLQPYSVNELTTIGGQAEREDLYKSALLRFKKKARRARQEKNKRIEYELEKQAVLSKKLKSSVRRKISLKKRLVGTLDTLTDDLGKKTPKANLFSQIPKSSEFSFDGAEEATADEMMGLSDEVGEEDEGETESALRRFRQEAAEMERERKKQADIRAKREAVGQKKMLEKFVETIRWILRFIRLAGTAASIITLGSSLLVTWFTLLAQAFAAHILKFKYAPKMKLFDWVLFIFLSLIIFIIVGIPVIFIVVIIDAVSDLISWFF